MQTPGTPGPADPTVQIAPSPRGAAESSGLSAAGMLDALSRRSSRLEGQSSGSGLSAALVGPRGEVFGPVP